MSEMPTTQQVVEKYNETRYQINQLKAKHMMELAQLETYQKAREDFLLQHEDHEIFGFMTDLFINGRDGKAAADKKKSEIGLAQEKIEAWLLKMLSRVGKSIATDFGTVYKTRKESVSVANWDAFVESELVGPVVAKVMEVYDPAAHTQEDLSDLIRAALHLELLNHAVNKTAILEVMGDQDEKTGARPNPPPAGVDYKAFAAVGVRKAK